jgi:hypothetical protein
VDIKVYEHKWSSSILIYVGCSGNPNNSQFLMHNRICGLALYIATCKKFLILYSCLSWCEFTNKKQLSMIVAD